MSTWVTSDTHFGHAMIIEYCKRPFVFANPADCFHCGGTGFHRKPGAPMEGAPCRHPDQEQMDRVLVARWNERVKPEDTVLHLGDFALGSKNQVRAYAAQVHGHVVLVMGNHDRHSASFYRSLGWVVHTKELIQGSLILRHRPPTHPNYPPPGSLVLCGHVHDAWRVKDLPGASLAINVGVDVRDFRPMSLYIGEDPC